MSECDGPRQTTPGQHEYEVSVEFVFRAAVMRAAEVGSEMPPAQIVETLRECLCAPAPEELRERIILHVRGYLNDGGNVGRD